MKINKEQLTVIGKAGLKVGKAIIIEGTKAVAVKSVTAIIMEGFDNGADGIKNMSVDKLVSGGKVKEPKEKKEGGLFRRKKKKEEIVNIEDLENVVDGNKLIEELEEAELVDKDQNKED